MSEKIKLESFDLMPNRVILAMGQPEETKCALTYINQLNEKIQALESQNKKLVEFKEAVLEFIEDTLGRENEELKDCPYGTAAFSQALGSKATIENLQEALKELGVEV